MASRPAPPGRKASTQGTTAQRVAAREGEGDDAPPPADADAEEEEDAAPPTKKSRSLSR